MTRCTAAFATKTDDESTRSAVAERRSGSRMAGFMRCEALLSLLVTRAINIHRKVSISTSRPRGRNRRFVGLVPTPSEMIGTKSQSIGIEHGLFTFLLLIMNTVECREISSSVSNRFFQLKDSHRSRSLTPNQAAKKIQLRSDFVPVHYAAWSPIPTGNNKTGPYSGRIFKVAIYHQPPLVIIDDWAAQGASIFCAL